MPNNPADYTILYSPQNSFVKLDSAIQNSCSVDILTCLPYKNENDISFQFKVKRGWVQSAAIDDEIDHYIDDQFLIKATTSCSVGENVDNEISSFANTYEVSRKILQSANLFTFDVEVAPWETMSFTFSNSTGGWTIIIPNIAFANTTNLAAHLQGIIDAQIPLSGVIVYASTLTQIKFISPDLTFVPASIQRRQLVGMSYVIVLDYVAGPSITLFEYEVTIGCNFEGISISTTVGVPFSFSVFDEEGLVSHCSNCFCPIDDDYCYSTLLEYYCNEQDALGFTYGYVSGGVYYPNFTNKIRLPFYLTAPQFPETSEVFRKSNGVYQKIASVLEEEYTCKTDYMPREWHKCLAVAMAHDEKYVTSDIAGMVNKKLESSEKHVIDWLDRPYLALAMGSFKVKTMPFNNFNSNMI